MGHKQPPTPMQTDNTIAYGFVTNKIASKCLKSMDMRIHWLQRRALQCQFRHYWQPGPTNLGDYVTRHHAAIHHHAVCPILLTPIQHLDLLKEKKLYKHSVSSNSRIPTQQGCAIHIVSTIYLSGLHSYWESVCLGGARPTHVTRFK